MTKRSKKNIAQIEGWSWNTSVPDRDNSTYEEYTFYKLHDKPLKDYVPKDMYFMIGQETGLTQMVEMALEELKSNLFIKAIDYPGDLLGRVMQIPASFWEAHSKLYKDVSDLIIPRKKEILDFECIKSIRDYLKEELNNFSKVKI